MHILDQAEGLLPMAPAGGVLAACSHNHKIQLGHYG